MDKEQKAKRIFLIGWNNERPAFINAALEMQNRGHKIIYWVVSNKQAIEKIRKNFKETIFHSHYDAIKVIPPAKIKEAEFAPPGQDLIASLYEIESILITMKKFYIISRSVLEKKHLFHRLVQYWYGIIKKLKPDIIFFSVLPHSVYNYTVYSIAKLLNIKTVIFQSTCVSDRILVVNDFKKVSSTLNEEYLKNQAKRFKAEDLSPDIQKYYQWHLTNQAGQVIPELKASLKNFRGSNKLKLKFRAILKSFKDFSFFKRLAGYLVKEIGSNMKKEYEALQAVPDLGKKYIYLPLHYQPEASTCPAGGMFVDQILMIKILSYCLPEGWLIYVKEHPVQWAVSSLAYFDFRYKGYYEEIARIKNVKILPLEVNSHTLIANSQALATVTGTAGMEAAIRLKPVLLFGYMWYQNCPGVFKVKNVATCREAIAMIKSGVKVDQQQLINYLVSFDKVSYHYNLEAASANYSKLTEEDMAKTLIEVMTSATKEN